MSNEMCNEIVEKTQLIQSTMSNERRKTAKKCLRDKSKDNTNDNDNEQQTMTTQGHMKR